jgi:hypothetical protein
LFNLRRIRVHGPQVAVAPDLDTHGWAHQALQEDLEPRGHRRQVECLGACHLASTEREQLSDERRCTHPCRVDDFDLRPGGPPLGQLAEGELGRCTDYLHEVVEVVRDAAGQLADYLELLSLPQLILERTPLADVPDGGDDRQAVVGFERAHGHFGEDLRPVLADQPDSLAGGPKLSRIGSRQNRPPELRWAARRSSGTIAEMDAPTSSPAS